ncbi:MAG: dTDP-4-dehydrorhamnose reductase [Bdellovibrionales bacterium]
MRILVFGAQGGLGRTFQQYRTKLEQKLDWTFCGREDIDVTKEVSVRFKIDSVKPHVVINASGYTAVDQAEIDKEKAFDVNTKAVATIAEICAKNSIQFVTYSTDFVFDGNTDLPIKERDPTNPINVYGQSKREGEIAALQHPTSTVIRTSWLYSELGKSFPKTILEKAIRGEELKIVGDQFSSPTWSQDLVRSTMKLVELGEKGLFHFSNSGTASWFDLAAQTIEIYSQKKKLSLNMPLKITTEEFPRPAQRPKYSVLNCDRIKKRGIICRNWKMALEDYVEQLIKTGL